MVDNIDLKDFLIQPRTRTGRSPYRVGGYSEQELLSLKDFMHQDFRHLRYGGDRSKGIIIEYPHAQISHMHHWKEALDAVLLPELGTLNPKLRNRKVIVRFDNALHDNQKKISVLGNHKSDEQTNGETWIRVSAHYTNNDRFISIEDAVFIIMHEVFESDFWSKTHDADIEALDDNNRGKSLIINKKFDEYEQLLDEKVANRRAVKAMRRYWPDFELAVEYDEDKV